MLSHALRARRVQFAKEITFITSANTTTSSVVIPATANVGDIAFLVNTGSDSGSSTPPPLTNEPAGWTKVATVSSSNSGSVDADTEKLYVRILTTGQPGSTVTGASGVTTTRMTILIFRPNYSVSTITNTTASTFGAVNSSSINQTQTINVSTLTEPIIIIAVARSFTTITGFTTTPAPTGIVSPVGGLSIRYLIQNSSKTNASTTFNMSGSTIYSLASFGMSFS
jgi:hypothetical protein